MSEDRQPQSFSFIFFHWFPMTSHVFIQLWFEILHNLNLWRGIVQAMFWYEDLSSGWFSQKDCSTIDQVWSILPAFELITLDSSHRGVNSQGGATPMQAKWIKLDLLPLRLIWNFIWLCCTVFAGSNLFSATHVHIFCLACRTPDKTRKTGAFAPRRASQISLEEEVPFSLLLEMSQQGNLEPKFPSTDSMVSAVWQQGSKILVSL